MSPLLILTLMVANLMAVRPVPSLLFDLTYEYGRHKEETTQSSQNDDKCKDACKYIESNVFAIWGWRSNFPITPVICKLAGAAPGGSRSTCRTLVQHLHTGTTATKFGQQWEPFRKGAVQADLQNHQSGQLCLPWKTALPFCAPVSLQVTNTGTLGCDEERREQQTIKFPCR